ncbi:MAG: hypothetical protein JW991_05245 [Candidatus Pacebacteria bacterium]|nr:hypothetical protein [Candidatus Paceibacterota bacterium]
MKAILRRESVELAGATAAGLVLGVCISKPETEEPKKKRAPEKSEKPLARDNPEKVLIMAGGNPSSVGGLQLPAIRRARQELEDRGRWPENLLAVAGVEGLESGYEGLFAYGMDIYVGWEDSGGLQSKFFRLCRGRELNPHGQSPSCCWRGLSNVPWVRLELTQV